MPTLAPPMGPRLLAPVLGLLAACLSAQGWTQALPALVPAPRDETRLVHDVSRWVTVMFGGRNGATALSDTWEWNGYGWTPRLTLVRPPARWAHGMAHDSRRDRVVLFGGFGAGGTLLNDTWEWIGAWYPRTSSTVPPARAGAGMVYDNARGVVVLFGGEGPPSTARNDTWEWDGNVWSQRTTTHAPPARFGAAMTHDTRLRKALLFGGRDASQVLGDTWLYDGNDWTEVINIPMPPARFDAGIGFDSHCGRAVLFGGMNAAATILGDAWQWDGATWQPSVLPGMPQARRGQGMTYEEQYRGMHMFGGATATGPLSEQWTFANPCSRSMSLLNPVVLGTTATLRYSYPSAAENHFSWMLFTAHQLGAYAVPVPYFPTIGLARVDVFGVFYQPAALLDATQARDEILVVPNSTALAGLQFDVQSVDVDLDTYAVWWADNDVEATVAHPLPITNFTATPASGLAPLTVTFTNLSQLATSYQWSFGDGTFSTLPNPPPKVYPAGNYTVTLAATGPGGTTSHNQGISALLGPVANFTLNPATGPAPLTVSFTNQSQNATSFLWDFGDGTGSTLQNPPPKTYQGGTYTVALTATSLLASATTSRIVTSNGQQPLANFAAAPTLGALPLLVQFTDTSAQSPTSWQWDFENDGTIDSTLQNPQHTYTVQGTYSVRLIATNAFGQGPVTRFGLILAGVTAAQLPVMVPIQPGTFVMGGASGTNLALPTHSVTISQPFWMSQHEVTQFQFQSLMGTNPSYFNGPLWPNSALRPVEQVTWVQAVAYCQALTQIETAAGHVPLGYQYRLPTEAEWEYCCRAGTTTDWNVGSALVCANANFNPGPPCLATGLLVPPSQTAPVGAYASNAFGLQDMHGNVSEWCLDAWDFSANYPSTPVTDPYVNIGVYRTIRGGSWNSAALQSASPARFAFPPNAQIFTSSQYGFRVVLAPIIP